MSRFFARFPELKRFAALLALLAMFVPAGTGLVHHPAAVQSFIHICGLSHAADHEKAPAHKWPSCPVCQSMHQLGAGGLPPSPFVLILIGAGLVVSLFVYRAFSLRLNVAPQSRPRAPPFSA